MRVWNHWKSECPKFSFVSQPWWSTRRVPRSFSGQRRFLELWPLWETFQLQQTNKRPYGKKLGFFHLGTPKPAFLMRNLPIDLRSLDIFNNKQGHSFQFPKKSIGGLPLLPSSLHLFTYFKVSMSPSKKFPWSFQNIWLLFCMEGEIQIL